MNFNLSDLTAVLPEAIIAAGALAVLLIEMTLTRREVPLQIITLVIIALASAFAANASTDPFGAFNDMVDTGGYAQFLKLILLGVTLLTVLMSGEYWRNSTLRLGEFYSLLLMATVGMMALATATDLVVLFIGLETMSIALYVLAGVRSARERSTEGALKYLVLGGFSSAFLLYGIALIYGSTGGKTNFSAIQSAIAVMMREGSAPTWLIAGVGLVGVGLLFKVAAVPFHFWSPDVYQGSPTPVTAFMSAGPKAAALASFIRLFGWGLTDLSAVWSPVIGTVAVATMIFANLAAISQRDIKRMLAYSSISHAGYLLLGIVAAGTIDVREDAAAAMLFYLTAYYLMNLGAFLVAIVINRSKPGSDYQIDDYRGLAAKHPLLAAAMAVFMISLTGIPPTAGFFGKFYLFSAVVNAGHITLVVIAVLMSVVSAYYYLRIVVFMFMRPAEVELKPKFGFAWAAVLIICVLGVLKFGLLPGDLIKWARNSSKQMQPAATVALMKR